MTDDKLFDLVNRVDPQAVRLPPGIKAIAAAIEADLRACLEQKPVENEPILALFQHDETTRTTTIEPRLKDDFARINRRMAFVGWLYLAPPDQSARIAELEGKTATYFALLKLALNAMMEADKHFSETDEKCLALAHAIPRVIDAIGRIQMVKPTGYFVHYESELYPEGIWEEVTGPDVEDAVALYLHSDARIAELEAQLAACQKDAWRPIETAPKDGTWILVVIPGYVPCVAQWNIHQERWLEFSVEDWSDETWKEMTEGAFHPRLWMPLPEQPIDAAIAAKGG